MTPPGRGSPRVVGALLVLLAASALAAGSCAGRPPGPASTLAAFGAALARKDYPAGYALTARAYQQRVPLAAFVAELDAAGAETQALGKQLGPEATRGRMRVEVALDLGRVVTMVEDEGQWRVDGASLELWSQRTPRAALRAFIRALDQRRYDIVLRLCPSRHRSTLTREALRAYWEDPQRQENSQLLARLRGAAGAPIIETGDEATLPYGDRAEVHFVREDGAWKIEDPD